MAKSKPFTMTIVPVVASNGDKIGHVALSNLIGRWCPVAYQFNEQADANSGIRRYVELTWVDTQADAEEAVREEAWWLGY